MKLLRNSASLFSVALLATVAALGQDANQILQKVAETYQNLNSFQFEGVTVSETKSDVADSKRETRFEFALSKPDKVKVEFEYPNAGSWVRVSDGKTTTRYRSLTKDLKQAPASPSDLDIARSTAIAAYEQIATGVKSANVTGSEPVSVGGRDVDCYVVEVQYDRASPLQGVKTLPTKYWIDKERFIVLRQVSGTESESNGHKTQNIRTISFTTAKVNEPVAGEVFAFSRK